MLRTRLLTECLRCVLLLLFFSLDIEPRIIPLARGRYTLDPDLVMAACDENTIGVMAILGNTLTGAFDPIEIINDRLIAFNKAQGTDIGIHVDGASGAFCVPFSHPDFKFDFRLDRVKSINVSGHKFGMVDLSHSLQFCKHARLSWHHGSDHRSPLPLYYLLRACPFRFTPVWDGSFGRRKQTCRRTSSSISTVRAQLRAGAAAKKLSTSRATLNNLCVLCSCLLCLQISVPTSRHRNETRVLR